VNKSKRHPVDVRASFSVPEIALRNGVSESYAYDEIKAGRLRATRLGGTGPMRVTRPDEARWIAGLPPLEGTYEGLPDEAAA
jgi:hypothetical protein